MLYELVEHILEEIVNWSILAFELAGVCVLILSGIKGVRDYFTHNPLIRLSLAEGMALALEFKLGSEILRTVIIQEMSELYFIAGIIILRASLTFLIHWEIDYEERAEAKKNGESSEPKHEDSGVTRKILDTRFKRTEEESREKAREKYTNNSKNN